MKAGKVNKKTQRCDYCGRQMMKGALKDASVIGGPKICVDSVDCIEVREKMRAYDTQSP